MGNDNNAGPQITSNNESNVSNIDKNDIIVIVNHLSMQVLEYIMRNIFPLILPGGWSILVINCTYNDLPLELKDFITRMIGRFLFKEIVLGEQKAKHIIELPHYTVAYVIKINGDNLVDNQELYEKIKYIKSEDGQQDNVITLGDMEIITKKSLVNNVTKLFSA